jgi:type I restriction enzyme, S subunit
MENGKWKMENKEGYKQTKIGMIPNDWSIKDLGDLGQFSKGKGILKDEVKENGFPCIRYGEIYTTHNYIIKNFKSFIDDVTAKQSQEIKKGDILFAGSGETIEEIGKSVAFLGDEKAFAGGDVIILSTNQETNSECLSYALETDIARKQKRRFGQGNSVVHIYPSSLSKVKIPLPPLPEQKKIAEILSTWDSAIETTAKLIAAKQVRKRALMQRLLTGKQRFPQFIGQAWEEVKLNKIFERLTRKNTEINTNVVTISAQRGFVRQTDFFNKVIASDILDNYFLVEKGEFCYNKSYSNGYPWGATKRLKDFEKAVVTTLYICFKFIDETNHSGDFFEHFFESGRLDKGLTKIAHEGGRAHGLLNVTPSDFFQLKITIPPKDEQTRIAEVLETCDAEISLHQKELASLKEQKRGLMQQLLTGKVRVKVEGE